MPFSTKELYIQGVEMQPIFLTDKDDSKVMVNPQFVVFIKDFRDYRAIYLYNRPMLKVAESMKEIQKIMLDPLMAKAIV